MCRTPASDEKPQSLHRTWNLAIRTQHLDSTEQNKKEFEKGRPGKGGVGKGSHRSKGSENPKGKGKKEGRNEAKGKGKSCKFFLSEAGCKLGGQCKMEHPRLRPDEDRCFNCGGKGHKTSVCTRPRAVKDAGEGVSSERAAQMHTIGASRVEVSTAATEGAAVSGADCGASGPGDELRSMSAEALREAVAIGSEVLLSSVAVCNHVDSDPVLTRK